MPLLKKKVATSSETRKSDGKPRRKQFLAHQDSVSLALSIASQQEEKALEKTEKAKISSKLDPVDTKSRASSSSKIRLKEMKAKIAADRARSKKEKAKRRKLDDGGGGANVSFGKSDPHSHMREGDGRTKSETCKAAIGKRVSFA